MEYLLVTVVSAALYWVGWRSRRQSGSTCDHAFASILVFMAVGVGAGAVAVGVAVWVLISSVLNPGTPIESNMPPQFDGKFLFGILIIGAPLSFIWAIAEYRRHLKS